jgi:hypothetical protein
LYPSSSLSGRPRALPQPPSRWAPWLITVFIFFAVRLDFLLREGGLRHTTTDDVSHDGFVCHSAERSIHALAATAREQLQARLRRTDNAIEVRTAELKRSTKHGVEVTSGDYVWVETTERVEILAQRESRECGVTLASLEHWP